MTAKKSKRFTIDYVSEYFKSFGYILKSYTYKNNKQKLDYVCNNGHEGSMTFANFSSGKRCPRCHGNKKHTFKFVKNEFKKYGYTIISKVYVNGQDRLDYVCPKGHKGSMNWNNFRSGRRCPECQGIRPVTKDLIFKEFEKYGYDVLSCDSPSSNSIIYYRCPKGHYGNTCWGRFKSGKRCYKCSTSKKKTIEEVRKVFYSRGYKLLSDNYVNNRTPLKYECPNGHVGFITFSNFSYQGKGCFKCSCSKQSSKAEKEIYSFICDLIGEEFVIENDRDVISPYELDVFIPAKNLAIEYCGLYWHGEVSGSKPRNYHYKKMNACNKRGIRLITIFEDEYLDKPEVVKSIIKSALSFGIESIYAIKCEVKKINSKECNKFLNKFHSQGKSTATVRWGLFYLGDLIQVLTVGVPLRKHSVKLEGNKKIKILELKRLATVPGINVVGGASKLFKRAVKYAKENNFTHIKSHCDRRYANIGGDRETVYEKLGFDITCCTKYTPHYVLNGKRFRNQSFRKTKEERNTGKTEWELRKSQGYDRIWDCGYLTYLYKV